MRRANRARRLSKLRAAAASAQPSSDDVEGNLGAVSSAQIAIASGSGSANSASNASNSGVATLMVHGPEFNNGEYVVVNPESFPELKPLDLVELRQPEREHPRLIVQVTSLAPVRGKLQVSLLKELAAQFGLEAFQPVAVTKVDAGSATVDYMEVTFKDQYLSSADIWRVKVALFGKCVYVGKTVECLGIRSQVEGLLLGTNEVFSGVIGDSTKIIVRSRSSRLFWLVQMSAEMWEFAPDGELYYEKLLNNLLREIIARWTAYSVSHSVTVIAFSRTYYDVDQFPPGFDPTEPPFSLPHRQCYTGSGDDKVPTAVKRYPPTLHVDPETGRFYEDFYKVVVLSYTGPDWNQLLVALKKEFATYHKTHRWRGPEEYLPAEYKLCTDDLSIPETALVNAVSSSQFDSNDECSDGEVQASQFSHLEARRESYVKWIRLPFGVPSRAIDGNILEAINMTLNILDKHHMDRDLNRTGQSIVMITAGCSIFNVQEQLAEITQQRMTDNGVGMDMISLAAPPLHVVPLFVFKDKEETSQNDVATEENALTSYERPRKLSFNLGDDEKCSVGSPAIQRYRELSAIPDEIHSHYQVPHWVNITFLDFDCKCSHQDNTQSHLPRSGQPFLGRPNGNYSTRLSSHRVHSCRCMNKEFIPLPPFRMFNPSASTEKVSPFPGALQHLIPGYPRRIEISSVSNNIVRTLDDELKTMEITRQAERLQTEVDKEKKVGEHVDLESHSGSVAVFPPDEWRISRSPDYAIPILPKMKRATTSLSLSLITREALLEYDAEVFSPLLGGASNEQGEPRTPGNRSTGFISAAPSPHSPNQKLHDEVEEDITTATIDGSMISGLADQRRGAYGSRRQGLKTALSRPNSTIGSLLSPRDDQRLSSSSASAMFSARVSTPGSMTRRMIQQERLPKSSAVTITKQRPNANSSASDPAQCTGSIHESSSPTLSTAKNRQALLSKSFDSSQKMRSRLKAQENRSETAQSSRSGKLLPPPSENYHLPLSSASSVSSSHQSNASDRDRFRPLERASTMNRATETVDEHSTIPVTRGSRFTARNLKMFSPSKYTGMRRGQSEIFLTSSSAATAAANGGFQHSMRIQPHSQSVVNSPAVAMTEVVGANYKKPSVNPFRFSAEALDATSQRLSVDRRRWTHLFPILDSFPDSQVKKELQEEVAMCGKLLYIGPNWKSLVTPAILPLTTDYFPSPKDLRDSYTESFYTLTLPLTSPYDSVPKYNNHDELLVEMICQRLACDFQLVASESSSDLDSNRPRAPVGPNIVGFSGGGRYSTRQLDQAPDSHTIVYHLSTGHRIHQLIYDPERQTIEVKQYFKQSPTLRDVSSPSEAESVPYRYSIWVERTQSFHPLQQEFRRFPTHNENWNTTDHLLCGYHDHMSDKSKCRRIRFAIMPPQTSNEASDDINAIAASHAAKFARFLDYLQSRVAPNDDGSVETISVQVELDASSIHHRPAAVLPKGYNSRCYKVCCRISAASVSSGVTNSPPGPPPAPPASSGSKTRSEDIRTEWLMLNLEDTMDIMRTYHIDVRWLACSGNVADEFVGAIKRKAKQAGLDLRRVPEYSSVSFLQIHPLIAPVLLPISASKSTGVCDSLTVGQNKSPVVEMVESLGFVLDDERIADINGIGYGLGIEREEKTTPTAPTSSGSNVLPSIPRVPRRSASFTTRMLLTKFGTRGYQQFIHRRLPVFVRVTRAGVVWIPSYEYDEKIDTSQVSALFHAVCAHIEDIKIKG